METESNYFDYNRLLHDLSSVQLFFGKDREIIEAVVTPTKTASLEPLKSQVPPTQAEERDQWKTIVQFMRDNPRFLIDMIDSGGHIKSES